MSENEIQNIENELQVKIIILKNINSNLEHLLKRILSNGKIRTSVSCKETDS